MSQKLRGLVAQNMSGQRKSQSPATYVYPSNPSTAAAYTFTAPKSGWFRFVMWGGGGGLAASVGSGAALVVAERSLAKGQTVALSVGSGDFSGGQGFDTTATLPSGEVLTAGGGFSGSPPNSGGVATGKASLGDILVNGSASTASPTSGAAATSGNYRGGGAGSTSQPVGGFPGGGGGGSGAASQGGNGVILIHQVRLRP